MEGLTLGLGDQQSDLDRRMAGLVRAQDYSAGSALVAGMTAPQSAPQAPVEVSLVGSRMILQVGDRDMEAYVSEHIADNNERERNAIVNGTGQVLFE